MGKPNVRRVNLSLFVSGRGRRLVFLIGTALSYGVFIGLVTYLMRPAVPLTAFYAVRFLGLLVLPIQFCLAVRRLHDLNASMVWAAPLPIFFLIGIYNNFATLALHLPAITLTPVLTHFFPTIPSVGTILTLTTLLYILLMDLVLAVIPGTKGPNRFGPDPRRPVNDADHF